MLRTPGTETAVKSPCHARPLPFPRRRHAAYAVCPLAAPGRGRPRAAARQRAGAFAALRSGYTGDEVLKETAGRPLLAPIDAAAERALLDAGADARTVAALRDGRRVASSTEADAPARQAAADQYKLSAWEADQARRAHANRQATSRPNSPSAARRNSKKWLPRSCTDKLVVWKDRQPGVLTTIPTLAGKKIFSALRRRVRTKRRHAIN